DPAVCMRTKRRRPRPVSIGSRRTTPTPSRLSTSVFSSASSTRPGSPPWSPVRAHSIPLAPRRARRYPARPRVRAGSRRRATAAAIAIGLAPVLASGLAFARASGDGALGARLDAALSARALRGASISALVISANDQRELYAKNADRALAPASNQKVLTAL